MAKIIAMYLPQYHEIPENNKWWGKGFTDWVSVKSSRQLFDGHRQPRVPLEERYYDLTDVGTLKWQAALARQYGIYGFGIYHYWFSSRQKLLFKPAELLLEHKEINIPFFLAWDNNSWVRTWSKYKHNTNAWTPRLDQANHTNQNPAGSEAAEKDNNQSDADGMLAKLEYGSEADWKKHFDYLNQFFKDERYIKINSKPLFVIFNYTQKDTLKKMCVYWNDLAKAEGYDGLYLVNRLNPYDSLDCFDALFTYEPMFSAWQNKNIITRVINKLKENSHKKGDITFYDYDKIWDSILENAGKNKDTKVMYGGFVSYDDTPRRGMQGKVVLGDTPEKFSKYLGELLRISRDQNKKFVFLTAWNEWGESAYLEPDSFNGYAYLAAVKKAIEDAGDDIH